MQVQSSSPAALALQARLVDGIQGLADLLAFGRGADYSKSLAKDGKAYGRTQRHLAALSGFSSALTTLLVNLGMLAVLALAIPLVAAGKVSGVMLSVLTLSALAGFEAVMPLPLPHNPFRPACSPPGACSRWSMRHPLFVIRVSWMGFRPNHRSRTVN